MSILTSKGKSKTLHSIPQSKRSETGVKKKKRKLSMYKFGQDYNPKFRNKIIYP